VSAIVLIGPMGSGKTTYGKKLAKRLGVPFSDTDRLIVADYGPITEIFEKHGEPYFRELETAALIAALERGGVVATGGGVVLGDTNREVIAKHRVLYLETSAKYTENRLDTKRRPLLAGGADRWQEIFASRQALYESLADTKVFTGGKTIAKVMDEIEAAVKAWN
jgi:shikimate kinase